MLMKRKAYCSGCGACASICPVKCINMENDEEGFLYPVIDDTKCLHCKQCERVCPFNEENHVPRTVEPEVFACKAQNDDIRLFSSSGGMFYLLAEWVIECGGVVYGVAMTNDCKAAHFLRAANINELNKLQGSKYVQAETGYIYNDVKKDLEEGKKVLFSGTPCQANALRIFLKKDYHNLYVVDVVCHGVASPAIWRKYVGEFEHRYNKRIIEVNFRYKVASEKCNVMRMLQEGKRVMISDKANNPYFLLFLKNFSLRPSCYECKSKTMRCADITLGDFWGIEKIFPQMDDGKGVSLVLLRSTKGSEMFDAIKDKVVCKEVDYTQAVSMNTPEHMSVKMPVGRDAFFQDVPIMTVSELSSKYVPLSIKQKIRNNLKSIYFNILSLAGSGGGGKE